ncbi:hypothetical protein [uncultured Algibacter sp.]|uniref:hypothetical protein n=1 Tax=uncultured Algibacter sp. TaxID=298659 RepID=UPI00262EF6C7|nr:hypothetical protein [uncultured Algibacter sp.]
MKYFTVIFGITFLLSCSSNREENENCKFLFDIPINEVINLNFYQELLFSGNSVRIPNVGNGGIIIAFTGADYLAWDASDPNHAQSACSVLEPSGLNATCGCEDKNEYSLVNGQPLKDGTLRCVLRNYRVEQSGNTLIISN